MSSCIRGRIVTIVLRDRRTRHTKTTNVVCPSTWTRSDLLRYVRSEHPDESVRILEWHDLGGFVPERSLWIVAPDAMFRHPVTVPA